MLLTNILIFLQLLKKSQINRNNFKRAKNLFRVSVGLNLLFLISTMPAMIVFLINNLSNVVFSSFNSPMFFLLLNMLSYIYYSLDFFVYLIANRLFRKKFYDLIKLCCILNKKCKNDDSTRDGRLQIPRNRVKKLVETNL